jgi:hypothetical protein
VSVQSGMPPFAAVASLTDHVVCVGHTESIADARFGVHTSVNTAGRRPRRERLVGDGDGHRLAGRSLCSAAASGACTPTCGNYVGATYTVRALLP